MTRKAISEKKQTSILLKSRRRCCLCFWLKGEDEVKKGQIAHLDGDHANDAESNLVFMCFDHHDEYDSTPKQSKGLRQAEVKRWRDELYKEMQYRFKSIRTRSCKLSLLGFKWQGPDDEFSAVLQAKNTGEVGLTHLTISIRLPDEIYGEIPPPRQEFQTSGGLFTTSLPAINVDPWTASESRQDLFEPHGRVCIQRLPGLDSILLPDHSFQFDALLLRLGFTPPGSSLELDYRIDAEDMPTVEGKLPMTIPINPEELIFEEPNS